ncbi:MmyB family transcriptional regulator [Streptomyces sp. KMM 9044]|uniref:MmyB family transcriptional regulator n=1 Tax=Streptomyces sp. KMM 9044 TaxID=2744474 RepID=UPI00215093BE|nr:hypothetical protein [Streptomyces sp. KMM 9044]WAX78424.1 hypothetical protein HUV60_012785 [Streptomyces sp. KMM 9044]
MQDAQGVGTRAPRVPPSPPDAPRRPEDRPSLSRLAFLDPHVRDLYVDCPAQAQAVVGTLRATAGRHPDDALLAALIDELTMLRAEFSTLWADHPVQPCAVSDYGIRHPPVGTLTVTQRSMSLPDRDQLIIMSTATPGSVSQAALTLLAQAAASAVAG